ncbi:MAG: thioredoxin family protein [Proteiniphilum sp.]|uniref:thioredoxin family protein n=1 Tax=Proteiniphilum sp. TaxID=1926877 RepID=UPI002B205EE7|nr:thioredoxin family protein [Proteiniphilum sp.]MEA5128343.1 thioredoxin family protein [Proteiniphilum sp.]
MKRILILSVLVLGALSLSAQPIAVGSVAPGFSLENIDGTTVSLSDYANEKGVMVIFSCNPCPYVQAYEDRMIALHNEFAPQGIPVVLINSNDPVQQPADSFDEMKKRAADKGYPFPYLVDEGQTVYPAYGATRTPEIFLLKNEGEGRFVVVYTGTVDDNYQDAAAVTVPYAANAIRALLSGNTPDPATTVAIGCGIKAKK